MPDATHRTLAAALRQQHEAREAVRQVVGLALRLKPDPGQLLSGLRAVGMAPLDSWRPSSQRSIAELLEQEPQP